MLLYALNKWPKMLLIMLWPYALCMANEVHNATPLKQGGQLPLELFSQVDVSPKLRHFHTLGSLVYVLDSKLQFEISIPK